MKKEKLSSFSNCAHIVIIELCKEMTKTSFNLPLLTAAGHVLCSYP